jgi:uncharacterized Fe-S cluster-containing radical SAM superfamily protein
MGNRSDVRLLPSISNISPVTLRGYDEFAEFANAFLEYFSSHLKDLRLIRGKTLKSSWTEFA